MPVSQYEKDRIARVAARKKRKQTPSKKATYKSPKTDRQKALDEIETYKMKYYGKPSSSTQRKAKPTATSGGSKSVRKVTSRDSGDTDLVKRLRKNPFKYTK